ncbi:uncharacterized protein G2W53_018902 [Senna tora]|uniref:Uncharacterized protein n=1 Tax=Senna tora TaxID=362788 RepID=A0A834TTA4_9FABA|nr:uncharacterized protein G2W53_018902 [Senna tora]
MLSPLIPKFIIRHTFSGRLRVSYGLSEQSISGASDFTSTSATESTLECEVSKSTIFQVRFLLIITTISLAYRNLRFSFDWRSEKWKGSQIEGVSREDSRQAAFRCDLKAEIEKRICGRKKEIDRWRGKTGQ